MAKKKMVKLNAQPKTPDEMSKAIDGVLNNLSMGRYDVRIDTTPSFNTQREQSFQLLMQVARFAPGVMQSAGDLIIKDSPLVNAKEIADRIKRPCCRNYLKTIQVCRLLLKLNDADAAANARTDTANAADGSTVTRQASGSGCED
jgi:hypothetical protein